MTKEKRLAVYNKYQGHCAYCGNLIDYKNMQVDHILSQRQGGTDDIDNLNPSCRRCNHYKRASSLKKYRELIQKLHTKIREQYLDKVAEDYGIIEVKPWDGLFYFEKVRG